MKLIALALAFAVLGCGAPTTTQTPTRVIVRASVSVESGGVTLQTAALRCSWAPSWPIAAPVCEVGLR